ncbi:hypothetical protein PYCC9005_000952 [Savitreella phatthalungensis]
MSPSLSLGLQCLLQTFLSQSALTTSRVVEVLSRLRSLDRLSLSIPADADDDLDTPITPSYVATQIGKINSAITSLDYEIRRSRLETPDPNHQDALPTSETLWVFCNAVADGMTALATTHTADEVGWIRLLLRRMLVDNNTVRREALGCTTKEAILLAGHPDTATHITKAGAEKLLGRLVDEGWLDRSDRGWVSLSARAVAELGGYVDGRFGSRVRVRRRRRDGRLLSLATVGMEGDAEEVVMYDLPPIKSCSLCRLACANGYRCADAYCLGRAHGSCLREYLTPQNSASTSTSVKKCPLCGERDWSNISALGGVGELAMMLEPMELPEGALEDAESAGSDDENEDEDDQ